mgnify:CR=1
MVTSVKRPRASKETTHTYRGIIMTDEQIIQLWNSTQISVAELAKRSNRTVKYLASLGIPT